jgi:hypothetical protein
MKLLGFVWMVVLSVLSYGSANGQQTSETTAKPKAAGVTCQTAFTTDNVLRLSPIAALDIGFGFGLGYERFFGSGKKFSVVLPFDFVLENTTGGDNVSSNNTKAYNTYFYFLPGVKFYPTGHKKITYAFGPSLMFGFGNNKTTEWTNDLVPASAIPTSVKYARKRFGVLMNNYVTYNIGKSFDIGLEGGLGFCYFDKETYNGNEFYANSSERKSFDLAGQFSLSVGYKF